MENKHFILDRLLGTIQLTRVGKDIVSMDLSPDEEHVVIQYANGVAEFANVAGDSGAAMIRDVMQKIH